MINAGVDHLATLRELIPEADCTLALDDDHLAPRASQRPGGREPNNAAADDETVN